MFWKLIIIHKVAIIASVALGFLFEYNVSMYLTAYQHWPQSDTPTLSSRLATWDSAHYLVLSEVGYFRGSYSAAFYPLWPALIWLMSVLTGGNPLVAGFLLANGMAIGAFWLLWRLIEATYGPSVSRDALILMLATPGALFFSFPYTESLFLLLVLVFFWFLGKERYDWPGLMAFLLPLTKAIGVFIIVPLAWHLFERKKPLRYWLLLVLPLMGYATYFWVMYASTGNAFEGFDAQNGYPYAPSIKNMFNLGGFFEVLKDVRSIDGQQGALLDRLLFFLFLALLPAVWRLNKTWFWYILPVGIVPAMTNWFMSYRRYLMVCFPIIIVIALFFQNRNRRVFFWVCVVLLAEIQAWAIIKFMNFDWGG